MTVLTFLLAMPTVRETLSRAPTHEIGKLIPDTVDDLIELIESENLTSQRRVEIALSVNPPQKVLRETDQRKLLFKLLKEPEAHELIDQLELKDVENPFTTLYKSRFHRGSRREEVLFEYFDVELPNEGSGDAHPGLKSISPNYGLFDYQREALDDMDEYLASDASRVFLHMPTGSGKTRISMSMVSQVIRNSDPGLVLWLAEGQELLDQAAEEFETAWKHLGDREVEVSRFYGSHEWNGIDEGFIVAGLRKLWNKEKTSAAFLANFSSKISLVVFDEAHRSVADTYQKMLQRLTHFNSDCGLMGLSATPGRTYSNPEEDRRLSELYERNKVSIDVPGYDDPFDYLSSEGFLSKPEFYELKMSRRILTNELTETLQGLGPGQEYPTQVLDRLALSDFRNIRIINKILELIEEGHTRIILFATTVKHARIISAVLKAKGIDAPVITSETPDYVREKAISRFRKKNKTPRVLSNYSVLTTGFDAPLTSAAVIARPTTSLVLYSQMVGRAIRGPEVGGTEEAEIWTVIDTGLPGFGNLTEAFWNWEDVW